MNSGINLVVKRIDPEKQKIQKKNRRLRVIGFTFLAVFTLASVVLFIFLQTSPITSLRQEEEALALSLHAQNEKIQSEVLIDKQLTNIEEILAKRSDLPEVVESFLSILPPTVSILSYQAITGKIEISVQSSSLSELETFLERLTSLSESGDIYKNVTLSDISLIAPGSYAFGITINN